jgi:lysozyme family protein
MYRIDEGHDDWPRNIAKKMTMTMEHPKDVKTEQDLMRAIESLRDRAVELGQTRTARTLERALGQAEVARGSADVLDGDEGRVALKVAIAYLKEEAERLGEVMMAEALAQCLALAE